MKICYFICFLSLFQIFSSMELGGVKLGINEQMVINLLYHFYPSINQEIRYISGEELEKTTNIKDISSFGISNIPIYKLKVTFTEKGINLDIQDNYGWIKPKSKDKISFKFSMNGNIYVTTKRDGNSKIIPNIYFTELPTFTVDLEIDNKDLKNSIFQIFKEKLNGLLNKGLEKLKNLPTIPIDEGKGLYVDCSLVSLYMKNGYLEVNSFAFLFNKNMPDTMQLKRIPLNMLPSITYISEPNQLYVSQYSINSALYTYFKTSPLSVKINVEPSLLELLLPTITTTLGFNLQFFFETTEPPSLNILKEYIEGKILGKITIKATNDIEIVFSCSLEINTKIDIIIMENTIISGEISELTFNIKKIEINKFSYTFKFEHMIKLKPEFVSVLNQFISSNIRYNLPTFFTNVYIKHEDSYLNIYYELKKEYIGANFNNHINNIQNLFKILYYRIDTPVYYNIAGRINSEINAIFKNYFPLEEKTLSKLYEPVKKASLQIPNSFNDRNNLDLYFVNLDKELTNYGRALNIPNNPLSKISYLIKDFLMKNCSFSSTSEELKKERFNNMLNEVIVQIMCLIEQSLSSHHLINQNHLLLQDFDFSKCLNYRKIIA